jgi:hypothetical protein
MMAFILWLLAVVLIIAGILKIVQRDWFLGIILIVVGLLIGPGGVSLLI